VAAVEDANVPIIACRLNMMIENHVDTAMRREYEEYYWVRNSFERMYPGETRMSPERVCEVVLGTLGINIIGPPTAVMFHRSLYKELGRINSSLIHACDQEYWLRIGVNRGLAFIPEILVSYRVHPRAASFLNQSEEPYRTYILEQAILFHEFVFHPAYAPLRAAADNRHPPIDLQASFARRAFRAWKYATSAAPIPTPRSEYEEKRGNGLGYAEQPLADWRSSVAKYPKLQKSFLVRMMRFRWTLRRTRRARALRPLRWALRPLRRVLRPDKG
jgi:hypothetical protein